MNWFKVKVKWKNVFKLGQKVRPKINEVGDKLLVLGFDEKTFYDLNTILDPFYRSETKIDGVEDCI